MNNFSIWLTFNSLWRFQFPNLAHKDYPKLAVDGDPLMMFWPLATLGYLYTLNPVQWALPIILVITFTSTVSYYELEKLFELVQSKSKTFNQGRWENESRWKRISEVIDAIFEDGITVSMKIIAINTVFLFSLEALLVFMILGGQTETVVLGLGIIPLIWISSILWRISSYSS